MTDALKPTRPVLRWHGGKWKLAPWILSHFPLHRIYVEPFGGAASVLMRKPRSYAEVYNDLDDEVVTLFRVLRDREHAARLVELLEFTPFARTEFRDAYEPTDDPVERSRRLIVRAYMGFGSNAHSSQHKGHRSTGFRANSSRSGTTPAQDWANYPTALAALIERLAAVVVENRDACQVMAQHDSSDTLHYVDPPYLPETRARGNRYDLAWRMYRHELSRDDHADLLSFLCGLEGMVALSGYPDPLYDDTLADWRRVEVKAFADGARERVEVLWLNPALSCRLDLERAAHAGGHGTPLFAEAAQ
ncbi:DNA adenine methylase [Mesorhizobium xinjiangense]|uniref:DNA adenine methylase n=1 Tax=Mesorhizobium xinjiangense TaxID=2678685 RepID=UPI0012EDEEAF|nr:DNA adenine methylase [Mesorhizobium xinjiangense]